MSPLVMRRRNCCKNCWWTNWKIGERLIRCGVGGESWVINRGDNPKTLPSSDHHHHHHQWHHHHCHHHHHHHRHHWWQPLPHHCYLWSILGNWSDCPQPIPSPFAPWHIMIILSLCAMSPAFVAFLLLISLSPTWALYAMLCYCTMYNINADITFHPLIQCIAMNVIGVTLNYLNSINAIDVICFSRKWRTSWH